MAEKKSSVKQKQEDIEAQKGINKRSVAQLHTSVRKFCADIHEQAKVNAAAVTHMHSGTQKIVAGIRELEHANATAIAQLHAASKKMQGEGAQKMQEGIEAQRKAFRAGGQAMHDGIMKISGDIHKLAQVNKQFAHDFYFG